MAEALAFFSDSSSVLRLLTAIFFAVLDGRLFQTHVKSVFFVVLRIELGHLQVVEIDLFLDISTIQQYGFRNDFEVLVTDVFAFDLLSEVKQRLQH